MRKRRTTYPLCHPDRPYFAKDLCRSCYDKQDRITNKERRAEDGKRWRTENAKAYKEANKEHLYEMNKNWQHKNAGRMREHRRKWKAANREAVKTSQGRYRALKSGARVNDFTADQWREMLERNRHCCFYCGNSPEVLQQDHVVPLSRGGNHTASNIVPACQLCNAIKGSKSLWDFLTYRTFAKSSPVLFTTATV